MKLLIALLLLPCVALGQDSFKNYISLSKTTSEDNFELKTVSGEQFFNKTWFIAYSFSNSIDDTTSTDAVKSTSNYLALGQAKEMSDYKFSIAKSTDDESLSTTTFKYAASIIKDEYWVSDEFTKFNFGFSIMSNTLSNVEDLPPRLQAEDGLKVLNTSASFGFEQSFNEWYGLSINFEKYFYGRRAENFFTFYDQRVSINSSSSLPGLADSILDISNSFMISDQFTYTLGLTYTKQKTSTDKYTTISNAITYSHKRFGVTLSSDVSESSEDSSSTQKLSTLSVNFNY
jgi:hypothetical protein